MKVFISLQVIGEGFHPKAGMPHAEVYALRGAGKFGAEGILSSFRFAVILRSLQGSLLCVSGAFLAEMGP